jgi:hypothetical protein
VTAECKIESLSLGPVGSGGAEMPLGDVGGLIALIVEGSASVSCAGSG